MVKVSVPIKGAIKSRVFISGIAQNAGTAGRIIGGGMIYMYWDPPVATEHDITGVGGLHYRLEAIVPFGGVLGGQCGVLASLVGNMPIGGTLGAKGALNGEIAALVGFGRGMGAKGGVGLGAFGLAGAIGGEMGAKGGLSWSAAAEQYLSGAIKAESGVSAQLGVFAPLSGIMGGRGTMRGTLDAVAVSPIAGAIVSNSGYVGIDLTLNTDEV